MQKAEPQHNQAQNQPAATQRKGAALESPQSERIAQLEAMAESSPQAGKQAQLAAIANSSSRMSAQRQAISAIHNSPNVMAQRRHLDNLAGEIAQCKEAEEEPLQPKVTQREAAPAKSNNTGLPDNLKNGIESLSGMSMDNVKVHYNSSQPAQLNALAYAQGTNIHVAPGQEQHLPHEAWHVVQQAQGRVRPTMQMKDGVPVNDDAGLEREADVMGVNALQMKGGAVVENSQKIGSNISVMNVVQRQLVVDVERAHSTEQEEVNVDALGYADILLKEYAQLMKDDASAIVKPRNAVSPKEKASAVKSELETVQLDAEELKNKFVSKLVAGNDWLEMEDIRDLMQEKLSSNLDYQDENGDCLYDLSDDEVWQGVADSPTDYGLNLQEIITEKVEADLSAVSTAGDLSGLDKYSEVWKRTLAFAAYEISKKPFYPIVGQAVAAASPQVPFLKLINDLNAGIILQLDFVEKYNSASGLGAEFEVALPSAKKTEYDGKAVVHTHYAAMDKKPNYGHTKPYANRKAKGYGYTKVDIGKINGINDSQKKYSDL